MGGWELVVLLRHRMRWRQRLLLLAGGRAALHEVDLDGEASTEDERQQRKAGVERSAVEHEEAVARQAGGEEAAACVRATSEEAMAHSKRVRAR